MKKAAIGMVAIGSIALVAALAARSRKLRKIDKAETTPAPETETVDRAQPA